MMEMTNKKLKFGGGKIVLCGQRKGRDQDKNCHGHGHRSMYQNYLPEIFKYMFFPATRVVGLNSNIHPG